MLSCFLCFFKQPVVFFGSGFMVGRSSDFSDLSPVVSRLHVHVVLLEGRRRSSFLHCESGSERSFLFSRKATQ